MTSLRTPKRPELGSSRQAGGALLAFAALVVFVFRERGVLGPAGRHRVEMTCRPPSVGIGLAVSLLTLAALLVAYVPGRREATRPS